MNYFKRNETIIFSEYKIESFSDTFVGKKKKMEKKYASYYTDYFMYVYIVIHNRGVYIYKSIEKMYFFSLLPPILSFSLVLSQRNAV